MAKKSSSTKRAKKGAKPTKPEKPTKGGKGKSSKKASKKSSKRSSKKTGSAARADDEWEVFIQECKKTRDGSMKPEDWTKYGYAKLPVEELWGDDNLNNIDHVYVTSTSADEFHAKYEQNSQPAMIHGCTNTWRARDNWTIEDLLRRHGNEHWSSGGLSISLENYWRYSNTNKDDAPIYLFEQNFGDSFPDLLEDYQVPEYFTDDLFHIMGEDDRPPYRWVIMGNVRTGSTIHIDPLGTSAWNTLFCGHKRWVMFPPGTKRKLVEESGHKNVISWFQRAYPRLKKLHLEEDIGMVECIQRPGETIFVPGGWWHTVLNVDFTIAVTQNFTSRTNLPYVWSKTWTRRPNFARHFYHKLSPELQAKCDTSEFDVNASTGSSSPSSTQWDTSSSLTHSDMGISHVSDSSDSSSYSGSGSGESGDSEGESTSFR